MAEFICTDGKDRFFGAEGESDIIRANPKFLTRVDVISGGDGASPDSLILTEPGFLDLSRTATHLTGIEEIHLALDVTPMSFNSVRLTGEFVHSATGHTVEIFGSAAMEFIDVGTFHDLGADDHLILHGANGDDVLYGGQGSDTIYGDAGNDQVGNISLGADFLHGGWGHDILTVGEGDNAFGDGGDDEIYADDHVSATIDGGSGQDTLMGFPHLDITDLHISNVETVVGADDGVRASVDALNEFRHVFGVFDLVSGGVIDFRPKALQFRTISSPLEVRANSADLTETYWIAGGRGTNVITGGIANDTLIGQAKNDTLDGGGGSDTLSGGGGSDRLGGGKGNDTLSGDAGGDTLVGNGFHDWIDGGAGNDLLSGTAGFIDGGEGFDIYDAAGAIGTVVNVEDIRVLARITTTIDQLLSFGDVKSTNGGPVLLKLIGSGFGDFGQVISSDAVDVRLAASAHDMLLIGTAHDDGMTGAASADTFLGELGNDTLAGAGDGDTLSGDAGADSLRGGSGNDRMLGGSDSDSLDGGSGADHLSGGDGGDTIAAGTGNDLLAGESGADSLDGAASRDVLSGGAGNDTLRGGDGADNFVFDSPLASGPNIDRIVDFAPGADRIILDADVFAAFKITGVVTRSNFGLGTMATSHDQHLLYNPETGALLYDQDGQQNDFMPLQFATLDPGLAISFRSFEIIDAI